MLPKENRLKKKKDFENVFKEGRGFRENFLFLKIKKNKLKISRFGFVVSKAVCKKAVLRNQLKRRLREALRPKLKQIKPAIDGVFVVLTLTGAKDFQEINTVVDKLLNKARLWK